MITYMRLFCLLPLLGLVLAGCQDPQQDAFERPGTWSLPPAGLGANDAALRTMVANPADLVSGTGEADASLPQLATHPVSDLFAGQRPRLANGATTQVGTNGNQQQQQQQGSQGGGGAGRYGDQ